MLPPDGKLALKHVNDLEPGDKIAIHNPCRTPLMRVAAGIAGTPDVYQCSGCHTNFVIDEDAVVALPEGEAN